MIYKQRLEPLELVLYRFLNARMDLSENDKKHFWTINKGFEGEVRSDIQSTKKSQPNVWPASFLKRSYALGSYRVSRFTNLLYSFTKASETVPVGPLRCLAMMISMMFLFSDSLS
jgi:hypothetical protein